VVAVSRRAVGNLPAEVTSFIGRRQVIADVRKAQSKARLVTLSGVGGVGKSRLARQVGVDQRRRFPDGAWLVELDRLHEPSLLPHTVLATLGIRDESPRPPDEAVVEHLADKQLLMILDNCEHLVDASAMLVSTLLSGAPGLRIMATSREPLGVDGELVLQVPPLSLPDPDAGDEKQVVGGLSHYEALALFQQRAAAVLPGFDLTSDNAETVTRLCRRLDGNALAIELAAVRMRVLTTEEILARLDDRFRLLTGGSRDAAPRHQTLHAVVDGSFELCSKPERTVWMRASVFSGSFDVEAAEAVCGDGRSTPGDVLDSLTGLVTKSVLVREEQDGGPRFRLLETIRAYGLDRLRDSGDEPAVRGRHRDHYLALTERAEKDWFGPRQRSWLVRLDQERANLWTAMDFSLADPGEAGHGVRMAGALWPYWVAGGYVREGRLWMDRALEVDTTPDLARSRALWADALITGLQGDTDRAQSHLEECHRILGELGDDTTLATACRVSGLVDMLSGDLDGAISWFERSLGHLSEGVGLNSLALLAYADRGVVHALSGDVERAIELCEQGRALCESHGETWALSWVLSVHNFVRLVQDDQRDISPDLREMLRIKDAFSDILGVLHAAEMLAWIAAAHRDARRAARLLGASEALWKPLGAFLLGFQPYLERHDICVARAREELGDTLFEELVGEGARFDVRRLVSYALGPEEGVEEPETPATPAIAASGQALTRREWQVADLVAQNLSNKEIAEQLVISQRTAETHVGNILSKLGFSSRGELARWVIEAR
jgi:predicted ATPase/DNA-binding CsgD family transcriptional regulator